MSIIPPPTCRGDQLCREDQELAKRMYVHRYTRDHIPNWARYSKRPDGRLYPVQFASDADWLRHTQFRVTIDGRLRKDASYCYSRPTYPDNPELRRPYL